MVGHHHQPGALARGLCRRGLLVQLVELVRSANRHESVEPLRHLTVALIAALIAALVAALAAALAFALLTGLAGLALSRSRRRRRRRRVLRHQPAQRSATELLGLLLKR